MPLTQEQIETKIRDVLTNDHVNYSEALMTLVIIPLMESYGLTPPYSPPPEAFILYNNAMANVAMELGVI